MILDIFSKAPAVISPFLLCNEQISQNILIFYYHPYEYKGILHPWPSQIKNIPLHPRIIVRLFYFQARREAELIQDRIQ